jgi:hypothetical protein
MFSNDHLVLASYNVWYLSKSSGTVYVKVANSQAMQNCPHIKSVIRILFLTNLDSRIRKSESQIRIQEAKNQLRLAGIRLGPERTLNFIIF